MPSFDASNAVAARLLSELSRLAAQAGPGIWPLALLAGFAGVALLAAGIRLGPFLAGPAGGAATWLLVSRMSHLVPGLGLPAALQAWVAAAAVGLACALVPILYPLLLGAVLGALWGATVPILGRAAWSAACGALALGAVAFTLRRVLFAATAAIPGAVLVGMTLVALTPRLPPLASVTTRPMLVLAIGAVLAVAGTAAQLTKERPSRQTVRPPSRARRAADAE